MASQPIPMDPKYIIDLVVKRRWLVIIPFFLAMVIGIVLSIKLPKVYEANTLILIQPQRVPKDYVQSIVSTDPSERIGTLSQQVLSRTNLEKIISDFNLFEGEEHRNMYVEDKLDSLRKIISIKISKDKRGDDAFSIYFRGKDPQTVKRVTDALALYFINENLKIREAQAVGTSEFIENELGNMRLRLEEVEAQLKNYRETYMGELPEQLDSNLRILDRLQDRLGKIQQNLSEAKIRLASLENEAAAAEQQRLAMGTGQYNTQGSPNELDELKGQLENLLLRYTKRHPDVVSLQARILGLEDRAQSNPQVESETIESGNLQQAQESVLNSQQRIQIREVRNEIRKLELEAEDAKSKISLYQKRIENTPRREQELLSLRRDYDNIKKTHDSLLSRKLEAEIAVNMERKQKGEQFRILDPARLPEKPISPNMKRLFLLFLAAGITGGAGLIFLFEYMDNSFKRLNDIELELNLPVLCSIPQIIDRRALILRRLEHTTFAIFGLFSVLLFAGFTALTQIGVEPTLEMVRKIVNL